MSRHFLARESLFEAIRVPSRYGTLAAMSEVGSPDELPDDHTPLPVPAEELAAVATRGQVPCPRCGSSDAVLRAAEIPPGQHIELETVTTTGTRVRGLEPEPVLVTSEQVERRDISVNVEPHAFPTRIPATVWLILAEFLAMMAVYDLWSEGTTNRVLAVLASVLGAGMLALYVRGWVDVWTLSRVRDQLLPAVLAHHRKAWLCTRCDCLFFEAGESPGGIEPLTAIPRKRYRERLWTAFGYRKYAKPWPDD